jgi:prepilin-type processing-associated H-X9-DG protein
VGLYLCPSRGAPQSLPVHEDQYGFYHGGGWSWAKTDYAANARAIPTRPESRSSLAFLDGTSNTLLVGEKAIDPQVADAGSWYWDEPYFLGGSYGTSRVGKRLLRDTPGNIRQARWNWGSAHPAGVNLLFADGSVRSLRFDTPGSVVQALLTLDGGEGIDLP